MSRFISSVLTAAFFCVALPALAGEPPASFSPILEPLLPAVVNISTTQKVTASGQQLFDLNGMPDDPQMQQFRELFKQFNQQFGGNDVTREVTSLGSGFVIDPSGYIVTNNHVIANADNITVIFSDDTHLVAKLIGHDPKTDLALLKVKPDKPLAAVKFGDSEVMKVGDWVIAVGNPFGLGGSVSAGIVSARERNINAGPFDDFIQTDAAINRGNSGGPLFNMKGEVVGVNAAIFSPNGGNIGIGFAVPSNMAKTIIDQLRTTGKIHRGWLGVKIQEVSDETANALGLNVPRGALVLDVGGPATGSGIQAGDVIVKFDGHDIRQMHNLPRLVADTKVGKKVEVVVWRKGKEISYSVTLGELPADKDKSATEKTEKEEKTPKVADTVLGMALVLITPELRAEAGLPKDTHGLIVTEIDPNGEGAKRGMLPGDLITAINQQPLETVKALKDGLAEARKAGRDFALLRIKRKTLIELVPVPTK